MMSEKSTMQRNTIMMVVSGFVLVCFCCSMIALVSPSNQFEAIQAARLGDPVQATEPVAAIEPAATDTPLVPAPAFEEIRGNISSMTDAQWNQYAESLKGLAVVNWEGRVTDVNEKVFGGYEVQIDLDPPVGITSYDVEFDIPDELALSLRKGDSVRFSGRIESVVNVLDVSLVVNLEGGVLETIE